MFRLNWLLDNSVTGYFTDKILPACPACPCLDDLVNGIHNITDPATVAVLKADEAAIKASPFDLSTWTKLQTDLVAAWALRTPPSPVDPDA